MSEETERYWWIFALCGVGLVTLVFICLTRIISTCKKVIADSRRNRSVEGDSTRRNRPGDSSEDEFSDLDELANLEEQMEIEQFLEEIRSSEIQSSISISTDARKEFIANVLISQRVSLVHDESKDSSEENDKGSEFFICRSTGDAEQNEEESDDTNTEAQCAICLLEYSDGDAICWSHNKRCNHHFHKGCMIEWLKSNDECPLCRNNYLALSDDEEMEICENLSLPGDPSVFSQATHVVPSISRSDGTFEGEFAPIQLDPVIFRVEDCIGQDNVSVVTSSDESIYTENDSWSQNDESADECSGHPTATGAPDAWSCPSVNNLESGTGFDNFAIEHRPRNRVSVSSRETIEGGAIRERNQEVSLELDDLIVDGLMQQLEKRASSREVPLGINIESSDSCGSVYTRGSKE